MAHLALSFLGGFAANRDGVPVSAFGVDKARGLLAYLAVESAGPHRRAKLNGLFWPELPEKNASHNLSQTLLRLRRALGDMNVSPASAFLKITAQDAQLNPAADCSVDVTRFRDLVRLSKRHSHSDPVTCPVCQQWLREAVELYCGDFLVGLFLPGCVEFEEWRLVQQESLRMDALDALERLAAYHEARSEFESCQEYARRQLHLEPWRESAHLRLMRSLASAGQMQGARKQYEAYRQTLADELGLAPAAAVTALLEQIQAGNIGQPSSSGTAGEGFWLSGAGERRQVTALACSRSGSEDPEDEDATLSCSVICERIHHRFGGWRAQRHGSACIIYFGYPQAYEDAARRAAHAGLALAERQGNEGPARIGIHTGVVLIGEGRGLRWQERDLVGDAPEIARVTQQLAAPGEVLVTEATRQLTQETFDLEPLTQPVSLARGQSVAYRVRGESITPTRLDWLARSQRLTTFVGRDTELAQLREWFEQAQAGLGRVALLMGEPGIGKSRLVWELRQRMASGLASRPRGLWWGSRCLPHYQNTSLYPMIGVLEQIFGFAPGESAASRHSKVDGMLAWYDLERPAAGWMRSVLLDLPADAASSTTFKPTITAAQREQMRELFVALIRKRAAEQPVTLVIEDLHWADPSTVDWLGLSIEALAAAPCLTLLTARPGFAPHWLTGDERHTRLALQMLASLPNEAVDHLVRDMTGAQVLDDDLRRRIVAETDGVPLFAEELTKAVLEQGGSILTAIPSTLVDSLAARLEHLGPARETAQWAATIGREFTHPVLKAVMGVDERRLEADLARLIEAELVTPVTAASQDVAYFVSANGAPAPRRYSFKHSLLQEAAIASLTKRGRQERHRRIAETLEMQFPRMVETRPEVVAGHYASGGARAKAVDFYIHAGERARLQGATLEAKNFFNRAHDLLAPNDHERRWRVLSGRERVLDTRGERSEQQADLDTLAALAETLDDDTRRATVYVLRAGYAGVVGDYKATLPLAGTAAAFARKAGNLDIELNALMYQAQTMLFLGEPDEAGSIVADILAREPGLTDESVRGLTLSLGAHYYGEAGDLARAVLLQRQSVAAAQRSGHDSRELTNRANLGLLYFVLGLYGEARTVLEEALTLAETSGHRRLRAGVLSHLASVCWCVGDLANAKGLFEQALAEQRAARDAYAEAVSLTSLGQLLEKEGDLAAAAERLATSRALFADIGAAPDSFEAQAIEARVALALGQPDRARMLAAEVWQSAQAEGLESFGSPAGIYLALANVFEGVGDESLPARDVIEAGYRDLMQRADKISNDEWRQSFLENVPENRALLARWREINLT